MSGEASVYDVINGQEWKLMAAPTAEQVAKAPCFCTTGGGDAGYPGERRRNEEGERSPLVALGPFLIIHVIGAEHRSDDTFYRSENAQLATRLLQGQQRRSPTSRSNELAECTTKTNRHVLDDVHEDNMLVERSETGCLESVLEPWTQLVASLLASLDHTCTCG